MMANPCISAKNFQFNNKIETIICHNNQIVKEPSYGQKEAAHG